MPLFSLKNPFDEAVEAATPAENPENEGIIVSRFLPVADKIDACAPGSKAKSTACSDCLRSVWKRVKNNDSLVGLHAVSLLDFLVKNAGVQFLGVLDDRDFVLKMSDFVKTKLEEKQQHHKPVAESLKARIQEWAEGEMKHITWIPVGPFEERRKERSNVRGLYNIMRRQGYSFPPLKFVDSLASETTMESEIERREKEELDRAIQASLRETSLPKSPPPPYEFSVPAHVNAPSHASTSASHASTSASHAASPFSHAAPASAAEIRSTQNRATSIYPGYQILADNPWPPKLVRAIYDFEAMEADELSLSVGDLVKIFDATDASWWRGKNATSGGEGLFPASFVEEEGKGGEKNEKFTKKEEGKKERKEEKKREEEKERKEEREESPSMVAPVIDEEKIKRALHLIQHVDPSRTKDEDEDRKLEELETECLAMGPEIDATLEATDKRHLEIMDLNKRLADALQMYHFLMIREKQAQDGSLPGNPQSTFG